MIEDSNQARQDLYKDDSRIKYPAINVYTSPRVFQQKIDHKSMPLGIYTGPIEANNVSKYYDQRTPDMAYLRKIDKPDGMIWQFQQMKNKPVEEGSREKLGVRLLICVCMYNQSKNAINLTLSGIFNNLDLLEQEGYSWEEIAVVIIQDGILKLVNDKKKRTYAKGKNSMVEFYRELDRLEGKPRCDLDERINLVLEEYDNFEKKGLAAQIRQNNDFPPTIEKNISLLYQNLWRPQFTDDEARLREQLKSPEERARPKKYLKLFSCFKHLNGTKLSSHLWFFQGFCRFLDPKYIVLLDVGTQPNDDGVANLIKGFRNRDGTDDYDVGGVTGLMSVDSNFPSEEGGDVFEEEEGWISRTFFSIQKAQEYEYIIAHFLDKNAESALGFLHVLPGAWSAYRYRALIKSDEYEPNLLEHSYFKMTLNPEMESSGYQQANMYLAEDRILSLGIYCQPKSQFYLKYIPDAGARTDPMKSHQHLMKQRRRWINSSLFAFLYVFKNYYFNASESHHNCFDRYFKLNLSMILALLSFATSYMTPSIYFYVLYSTIFQIDVTSQVVSYIARIVALIYVIVCLIAIAGGLAGAVWTKHAQYISSIFSIMTFSMLGLVAYNVIAIYLNLTTTGINTTSFTQMSILIMLVVNVGGYFLLLIIHLPTHGGLVGRLFSDVISYWFYQGAYAQTMVIHSFCNVDDVSWGTKGSTGAHGAKGYETEKVFFVSGWIFWNAILAYLFIYIDTVVSQPEAGSGTTSSGARLILVIIAIYGTVQMGLKLILAYFHHFKWMFTNCCRGKMEEGRVEKVERVWKDLNNQYRTVEEDVMNKMGHSRIIRKMRSNA